MKKHADIERIRSIKTFPSLVKYLRDELDWPIDSDDYDDLTFDYQAEELGLDSETAVKIKEIKQLRPLTTKKPWGIFFVNFEPKRLPVVVLRPDAAGIDIGSREIYVAIPPDRSEPTVRKFGTVTKELQALAR